MRKIIAVVGSGMIGRDPWDPKCWSRAGYNLFSKLREQDSLYRAFGVEVGHPLRGVQMLKNFSTNKAHWRQKFNLDPWYYNSLTNCIQDNLEFLDFLDKAILQIGNHYDSAKASGYQIPSYAYSDGNIAGMMVSPYFPQELIPYAERAFEYEKQVCHNMTKVFTMSTYWRDNFINEFDLDPNKVVSVGFGVNVDIPNRIDKDYSKQEVLFVGIDWHRKGGDTLVEAFVQTLNELPNARLHIVGPGFKSPVLQKALEQYPNNILFYGLLSRENPEQKQILVDLYKSCTLFVLPSVYEPAGNANGEAMANGIPVIATNDWSFPDIVKPGFTGDLLSESGEVKELAWRMTRILGNTGLKETLGTNARALIQKSYTWDVVAQRIFNEVNS